MPPIFRQFPNLLAKGLILPIRFYQLCISPMFPGSCRFTPTCSQYAVEALRLHGPAKGLWLAVRRLSRCHPWGGSGYDPVPLPSASSSGLSGGETAVIDVHTHHISSDSAIISMSPDRYKRLENRCGHYSIGIHPWDTDKPNGQWLPEMEQLMSDPEIVAIGETGLDSLRGGDLDTQKAIFLEHIRLSETTGKPLVIHLVKALDRFLETRKATKGNQPWIIHGFRGKPELLRQLMKSPGSNPLYFSIGEKFNPATVALIPADRLLVETDESPLSSEEILRRVAQVRNESPADLAAAVNANALRLFPSLKTATDKEKH